MPIKRIRELSPKRLRSSSRNRAKRVVLGNVEDAAAYVLGDRPPAVEVVHAADAMPPPKGKKKGLSKAKVPKLPARVVQALPEEPLEIGAPVAAGAPSTPLVSVVDEVELQRLFANEDPAGLLARAQAAEMDANTDYDLPGFAQVESLCFDYVRLLFVYMLFGPCD